MASLLIAIQRGLLPFSLSDHHQAAHAVLLRVHKYHSGELTREVSTVPASRDNYEPSAQKARPSSKMWRLSKTLRWYRVTPVSIKQSAAPADTVTATAVGVSKPIASSRRFDCCDFESTLLAFVIACVAAFIAVLNLRAV